jgi:integrase
LSWYKDTADSPISKEFSKLAKRTGIYRSTLTFYSLRHTFETIAGDTGDQVAVDYVMGHVDSTMAGTYREHVFNPRLERIAQYVHSWLFGAEASHE